MTAPVRVHRYTVVVDGAEYTRHVAYLAARNAYAYALAKKSFGGRVVELRDEYEDDDRRVLAVGRDPLPRRP